MRAAAGAQVVQGITTHAPGLHHIDENMQFALTAPEDFNSQIESQRAAQEICKVARVVDTITTPIEQCTTDGAEVAPHDTAGAPVVQRITKRAPKLNQDWCRIAPP